MPIAPSLKVSENPFNNQRPTVDPTKFIGRAAEIEKCIRAIGQHGNIVIAGTYGIGKTSLVNLLSQILAGDNALRTRYGLSPILAEKVFATTKHGCASNNDLDTIMGSIVSKLRAQYVETPAASALEYIKSIALKALKWRYTGTVTVESAGIGNTEVVGERANQNKFQAFISNLMKQPDLIRKISGSPPSGLVIFIDEVEVLPQSAQVGSFVKSSIDHFTGERLENVSFVISGAEDTAAKMARQVGGARRVFDTVQLEGMSDADLRAIISTNLRLTKTTIDDGVASTIVSASNHSPARLHYICWSAFEKDTDGTIGRDDFLLAANEIVGNMQAADFGRIRELTTWSQYKMVLQCLTRMEGDGGVSIASISSDTGIAAASLSGYMKKLAEEDLVVKLEQKDNELIRYTLSDPILGLYFRLAQEAGIDLNGL